MSKRHILAQLTENVDLITGEVFLDQHVCKKQRVIRSLYRAMSALEESAPDDLLP